MSTAPRRAAQGGGDGREAILLRVRRADVSGARLSLRREGSARADNGLAGSRGTQRTGVGRGDDSTAALSGRHRGSGVRVPMDGEPTDGHDRWIRFTLLAL